LPATAIILATVWLAFAAFGQQSVRTPEIPPFTEFAPNPEEGTFVRLGPFSGTAAVGFGYLYTDNANTSGTNTSGTNTNGTGKISLNEIFQDLGVDLAWPLSPFNRIDLRFGGQLQENFYSNGTNALNVAVNPDSQIQLEAKVGEFLLRAFERFTILQDPVSDPSVAGQTNLNRLSNIIGVGVDWPLYHADLGLSFAYTYSDQLGGTSVSASEGVVLLNSFHLGSKISFQPLVSQLPNERKNQAPASSRLSPTLSYGLEVNASYNAGNGPFDFYTFSLGPFIRGNITPLLEVDAGIGPLLSAGPAGEPPQYYGFLAVRYHPSRLIQILAGIDHDTEFSSGLGVTQNNNVRLTVQASLTRKCTFTVGPYVNFGSVITGEFPGSYTQIGVETDLTYAFSRRITGGLTYRYVKRNGGENGGGTGANYTQNTASVSLSYHF